MDVKLIIFDFGGTIDTNGIHWSELFWNYYQKYKIPITYDAFNRAYVSTQKILDSSDELKDKTLSETIFTQLFLQDSALFEESLKHYLDLEQINIISEDIYKFVKSNVRNAIETIKQIKINKKLAIVSNFNGNLKIVCDELGLSEYFDYLIDSTVVKLWKPDPQIFEYCLRISGIPAVKSAVVGDSYSRDISPAKSLGCNTIWLKNKSWENPGNTNNADLIINSFNELTNIF